MGKESICNAGDTRDTGLIPGEGSVNPLQYSCLGKNSMDRGAWWATVCGTSKELGTTLGLRTFSFQIKFRQTWYQIWVIFFFFQPKKMWKCLLSTRLYPLFLYSVPNADPNFCVCLQNKVKKVRRCFRRTHLFLYRDTCTFGNLFYERNHFYEVWAWVWDLVLQVFTSFMNILQFLHASVLVWLVIVAERQNGYS